MRPADRAVTTTSGKTKAAHDGSVRVSSGNSANSARLATKSKARKLPTVRHKMLHPTATASR